MQCGRPLGESTAEPFGIENGAPRFRLDLTEHLPGFAPGINGKKTKAFWSLRDDAIGTEPDAAEKKQSVDPGRRARFRRIGAWSMVAGVCFLALPFVGPSFPGIPAMSLHAPIIGGVQLIVLGATIFRLASSTRRVDLLRLVGVGAVCLVIMGIRAAILFSDARPWTYASPPAASAPHLPEWAAESARSATGLPGAIPAGPGGILLSNPRAEPVRESLPGMRGSYVVSVDFASRGRTRRNGVYVIFDSVLGKSVVALDDRIRSGESGTIQAPLQVGSRSSGSVDCYLGEASLGGYRQVSNAVTVSLNPLGGVSRTSSSIPRGFQPLPRFDPLR
jgi:hypothetical protein